MSFVQAFFLTLLPHLTEVASAVIAILLAGLFRILKTRWGIEIEARHREALQSAMMTGITAALARGLKADAAITAAIQHAVGAGARDAVEYFDLGMDDLKKLAESKLHSALPLVGIDFASGESQSPDPGRRAAFDLGRAVSELKGNPISPNLFDQVKR